MKRFLSGAGLGALAGAWLTHALLTQAPAPVPTAAAMAAAEPASLPSQALAKPAASMAAPRASAPGGAPLAAATTATAASALYPPLPVLSREHLAMVQGDEQPPPPTPQELHRRMSQEPVDPAWSPRLEAEINAFLTREAQPPVFEAMGVSCRLSICRIALFVNGAEGQERWRQLSKLMYQQAWWSEFSGSSISSTGLNDRKTVMVLLERKQR